MSACLQMNQHWFGLRSVPAGSDNLPQMHYQFPMIPVLKSKPQYQIEMPQQGTYPFNGLKSSRYNVNVKLVVPFSSLKDDHEIVRRILAIENPHIIKPFKVVESHLHQTYTFIYEYAPFSHNCLEAGVQEYMKSNEFKANLLSLFKDMVTNGVRPPIQIQNFGYCSEYRLKMFVKPDCALLMQSDNPIDVDKLAANLMEDCERLFKSRDEGEEKWRIKVSGLSEKLKKIQKQILCKDFRKKEVKLSESGMNSSENSDSLARTGSNEKIGNAHWHFDPDFHFEDSYSVRDSKNKKKKRTSSFKVGETTKSQMKPKKASWEGSLKQEKSSANESDKMTVLKKRISQALLKTQKTLTKYERIRVKSGKKKYTQK